MKTYSRVLKTLVVLILGLMALGAGVRTMNAGLSCPDWPLCFGKIIPDFHPAVWFEFVHRAYAGIVSIVFIGVLIYAFRGREVPTGVKRAGLCAFGFLLLQIVMGGLTVLLQVKYIIVTMHLMLATLFYSSVLWMSFAAWPSVETPKQNLPAGIRRLAVGLALLVFVQIFLGGLVASTYAGMVCVDWPLCNGQWIPTLQGVIGLQIIHRLMAYTLGVVFIVLALFARSLKSAPWMTPQILRLTRWSALVVCLQICIGVANLLLYIPPHVTVLHQSVAIILLSLQLRAVFVTRLLGNRAVVSGAHS